MDWGKTLTKLRWQRLKVALCIGLACGSTMAAELAIVIDDLGYNRDRDARVLNLPQAVAVAVLPFAPHAQEAARRASAQHRVVLLHQPMQPGQLAPREPGTLYSDMSPDQLSHTLAASLDALPMAVGVNNHTGSLLTAQADPMRVVMQELKSRGLFFLDSRTTKETVALKLAQEANIPATRRDVFLDHRLDPVSIRNEFRRALHIARRQGHAVVIGHPHRLSLDFLEEALAELPRDIKLVSLNRLLRRNDPAETDPPQIAASPHKWHAP